MTLLSILPIKPEYLLIIGGSLIIIISFVFNFLSKKTNIPSVLMLMVLGVAIQYLVPDIKDNPLIQKSLIIVGKVGLILIVLEAALDLKLSKDKIGLIVRSFFVALFALGFSSVLIAFCIQGFLGADFYRSLIYAVPLSIMSSAIIIPSVTSLAEEKKEFMIYESTFSDILGIIFFQFLTAPNDFETTQDVIIGVSTNIGITILVAVIFSYIAVWIFNKLTSHVKLFLVISILTLMYGIGSVYHLSSLIIILFFGIILNNVEIFFRGPLKNLMDKDKLKPVFHEFHIITLESAFFLRTFFFVMFGISISLLSLVDLQVAIQSVVFVAILYVVRFLVLKIILWNREITPQLWIAPRGLITVLLFYTIPNGIKDLSQSEIDTCINKGREFDYLNTATNEVTTIVSECVNSSNGTFHVRMIDESFEILNFEPGVLLYTILITSLVMTFSLIKAKGKKISDVMIKDLNFNYIEDGMEEQMEGEIREYHESELGIDSTEGEIFDEDIKSSEPEDIISDMEDEQEPQ